jgi:hypothetical protein
VHAIPSNSNDEVFSLTSSLPSRNPKMSPTSPSRHQNRLTPLHQTIRNAVKSAIIAPAKYIKQNPSSIAHKYALLIAGATLSRPLLTLLPLGPFGPLFAILSTSFARFKLRQHAAGSYYALLHSAGLQGISGQALSLASFMGLGAVFGKLVSSLSLLSDVLT